MTCRPLIPFALLVLFLPGCDDFQSGQMGADEFGVDLAEADEPAEAAATAEEDANGPNALDRLIADQVEPKPEEKPFERVAVLVDKQQAMAENPNYVETDNDNNAGDYFSAVAGAYFSAASQIHVAQLTHEVRLREAMDGRKPTFEEFETILKNAGVQLKGLYPWQVYAYDDRTGQITILTDPVAEAEARGK